MELACTRESVATALPRVKKLIVSTLTPVSELRGGGRIKAHTILRKARACRPGLTMHPDVQILVQSLVPATHSKGHLPKGQF